MADDIQPHGQLPPFFKSKLCVIIPCKDAGNVIRQALPHWLSQTRNDYEIILVDYNSKTPVYSDVYPIAREFSASVEVNPPELPDRYTIYPQISIIRLEEGSMIRDLCKKPPFAQSQRHAQFLILEIFNIFVRLKLSPSLTLTKIKRFSKVSLLIYRYLLPEVGSFL